MNDNMEHLMRERLHDLSCRHFVFTDDSHLHIGHAGAKNGGGHYRLLLVSEQFDGVPRIARQRMVQQRLTDLFANGRIHALAVTARTPSEHAAA